MIELNNVEILTENAVAMMRDVKVKLGPDSPLTEAIGYMREEHIFDIPVVEKGKLIGMVSYDIFMKRKKLPLTTKVKDIMIHPPKLHEDDTILDVARAMMNSGYRSVPIVSRTGRLRGIVRRRDFIDLSLKERLFRNIKVEAVMSTDPMIVSEKDDMMTAMKVMRDLQVRAIPVVDKNGRVSGVIGLSDIAEHMYIPQRRERKGEVSGKRQSVSVRVDSLMKSPPVTVLPSDGMETAMELMKEHDISTIVVVDDDNMPVGIVAQVDIIETIAAQEEKNEVDIMITGLDATDPLVAASVYNITTDTVEKMSKLVPIRRVNLYVTEQHVKTRDETPLYSFRARLYTDRKMFYAKSEDREPFVALDSLLESLEKQIRKHHEIMVDHKKATRRRG